MKTEILYEDNSIMVVYKPAGLATQTARIGEEDAESEVRNYLAGTGGKNTYVGVVHRLDQPVEGILVFAKTRRAAATLSADLGTETAGKEYIAAVYIDDKDALKDKERTLTDYIYKDKNGRAIIAKTEAEIKNNNAKKAVLTYSVIGEGNENGIAFLRVALHTGRFHQIRAQLSNAGLPILGDLKYGNDASIKLSEGLNIRTVALCADRLSFTHPDMGKSMNFSVNARNPIFGEIYGKA